MARERARPQAPHELRSRSRRNARALALVLLAVLVAWVLWPSAPKKKDAAASTRPGESDVSAGADRLAAGVGDPASAPIAPGTPSAAPPQEPPPAAPIIDEITIEKKEVCQGEDNLVTVRAHTPDGNDGFLHYVIGADTGSRVPLRIWDAHPKRGTPRPRILAFTKNNVSTSIEVPEYRVMDCRVTRVAFVEARINPNTNGEYMFHARLFEPVQHDRNAAPPKPFKPVRFDWRFGDGSTKTTNVAIVDHSYEDRPQTAMFSQYLVEVDITGEDGSKIVGRGGVQLLNGAWEAFAYKGLVQLLFASTPRFPEVGKDGVVRQRVRIWHLRPDAVTITKVSVVRHYMGAVAESSPDPIDGRRFLGVSEIPPGHGIEIDVSLDAANDPDTFQLSYQLEGVDAQGRPARGMFAVMRPPPKPTREKNDGLVRDALFQAKILEARRILGQDFVTEEDMIRLEREGRFADLKPDPSFQTPPPSEPPRPEVPRPPTTEAPPSGPPKDRGPPAGYRAPSSPNGEGDTPLPPRNGDPPPAPKVTYGPPASTEGH